MRLKVQALLCATVLAAATSASAQDKPPYTFEFHGLVGGSMAVQDQQFKPGNFQQAWYPSTWNNTHKALTSADVRQSQISFGITGPQAFGATPKGLVAFDFSNGPGPSALGGYTSALIRLRFLYVDLNYGNTVIRIGQDGYLIAGAGPWSQGHGAASVGNIDYPITLNAGGIGWREPGVAIFHKVPMGNMALDLSLALTRSTWQVDTKALPQGTVSVTESATTGVHTVTGTAPDGSLFTMGEASGLPAVEARIQAQSKRFRLFLAGHFARVHRTGPNNAEGTTLTTADRDVVAAQGGLMLNLAPLIVQGGGYTGKNLTPLLGNLLQWPQAGDIHEWGAWGQLGMFLSKTFSAWAFVGTSHPNYKGSMSNNSDATAGLNALNMGAFSPTLQNTRFTGMLRWMQSGMMIGIEGTHWVTRRQVISATANTLSGGRSGLPVNGTLGIGPTGLINANQIMLSGMYAF